MPTMLKYILTALGGLAVGAIGGYAIARHELEKAYDAQLADELDRECARLRSAHQGITSSIELTQSENEGQPIEKDENASDEERESEYPNTYVEALNHVQTDPNRGNFVHFTKYRDAVHHAQESIDNPDPEADEIFNAPDDDDAEDNLTQMEIYRREHGNDPPEEIAEEEYNELHPFYARYEWAYFIEDGVLLDEDDNIVDNQYLFCGDILESVESPGKIYIKCGRMGLALYIVAYDHSYDEFLDERVAEARL